MGDTDLSGGGSPPAQPGPISLPDLIRAGGADAFAGVGDAHIEMVRAYCEVACTPELVTEASEAAFLDFVGRMAVADAAGPGPEAMLLAATRSAAASRFAAPATEATEATDAAQAAEAESHRVRRRPVPPPWTRVCAAMPELLAARANGELRGDDQAVTHHVAGCALCTATEARGHAGDAAFMAASGWLAGDAEGPA